ncbi:phage adaptor protein [Pseudoduganella chitinolytica]|uniref:Uncharacterized protein n=1 Tax=Pseudoduganella chitinolytica TaxID=34070 RepID=A0ABY8BG09_9BURK|nr:hypothetical protein [Pseudoduganella chitinolytica]WEF34862.1 hypothetical protein PX653_08900 [Pseudoduganella chitinolytica]
MALTTYDGLVAAVASWAHNKALAPQIPDCIALAEARIKALLQARGQEESTTLATVKAAKGVTLPADLLQVRAVSIPGIAPSIDYVTPAQYAAHYDGSLGQPREYTMVDGQMQLGPVPDAVYSMTLVYQASYPALSSTNQTNGLLTKWPNLYLWGALVEAATFMEDPERLAKYEGKFASALAGINTIEATGTGSLTVKTDTRTP